MNRMAFAILLGSTALVPATGQAQTTSPSQQPTAAQGTVCQDLVTFLERRGNAQPTSPVTLDQARGFVRANDTNACRDALGRIRTANIELPANLVTYVQTQPTGQQTAQADTSRITVQQTSPTVRVEQAAPQVSVQQQQPQVTVRQPMPEIIVRQAPPTIRVEQPQPEIIVRMPEPQVNVAQAPPQVQVNTPQPQVQVVQPQQQPQVDVQREQPTVNLTQAQGQANVQVQREGQPQVRYERTGQPNIVYNQAEGQPQIRYERMGEGQQAGQAQPAGQVQNLASTQTAGAGRGFDVTQLEDMEVYNTAGQEIGEVEDVLIGPNNQTFLVVAYGGFLGIGERRVTIPMDRVQLQGNDRLVATGYTDEQLRALQAYDQGAQGYRAAETTHRVDLNPFTGAATTASNTAGGAANTSTAGGSAAGSLATAGSNAAQQNQTSGAGTTAPATTAARTGTSETTGALPANAQQIAVSRIADMNLYNTRGEQLGDVERVIMGNDNKMYLIVGSGGFLGLGEKRVAIPMERVAMQNDRLVVQGITDDQIKAMPTWDRNTRNYRELEGNAQAPVSVVR